MSNDVLLNKAGIFSKSHAFEPFHSYGRITVARLGSNKKTVSIKPNLN